MGLPVCVWDFCLHTTSLLSHLESPMGCSHVFLNIRLTFPRFLKESTQSVGCAGRPRLGWSEKTGLHVDCLSRACGWC